MNFVTKTKSILWGMEFNHGMRRALMSTLGIVYFLSFGFDVVSVTTLFAISTIIMTFFEFPTGAIADYDSRKKSIAISFLLMSIAFFGLFFFRNFYLLSASWILGDIAWTFYSGAGSAWSIDALNIGKKKSKIVSLISRNYFFERGGHIIGGLIGLFLIALNFSFIWLAISISNLFMLFIVIKYMEERNFIPGKVQHNYLKKALIKAKESFLYIFHKNNKQLKTLMLGSTLGNFAYSAFIVGMPILFTEILKISPEKLSGIVGLVSALTIISPFVAEKIAHKYGVKNSMITFVSLISLSVIVFALSKSVILAIAALVFSKIFLVIVTVIEDSAHQNLFDSKIRASLGSTSSILWALSFAVSVFITGFAIKYFGVVPTLIVSGVLILVEAAVYMRGLK